MIGTLPPRIDSSLPPLPGHRHASRGEVAFDNALRSQNLRVAAGVAAHYMDGVSARADAGIYTEGVVRLALKEVALPLFARASYDFNSHQPRDEKPNVIQVYDDAVSLLGYFRGWSDYLRSGGVLTKRERKILTDFIGSESEIAYFALPNHDLTGEDNDRYTVLPSTLEQDQQLGPNASGESQRFDFIVRDRQEGTTIRSQVKSGHSFRERYAEDILVVHMSDLSGDSHSIRDLEDALLADVRGNATLEQLRLLVKAIDALDEMHKAHFAKYAAPVLTAYNL